MEEKNPVLGAFLEGVENLFSIQYLWVYTSHTDKAEALSNQSSRSWFLGLKKQQENQTLCSLAPRLLCCRISFLRGHAPSPTAQCGVFAEMSSLLSPSAAPAASCPLETRLLFLTSGHLSLFLRAWDLTSPESLHLPLAVFRHTGASSQPLHLLYSSSCPRSLQRALIPWDRSSQHRNSPPLLCTQIVTHCSVW